MHIDRLTVKNFRNLANVDLQLLPGTVLVGQNCSGKSNLIHALRLILDPTLSFADRQLDRGDFWDGLSDGTDDWDPMSQGEVIEASIDLIDFGDNPKLVATLGNALLAENPLRARLTYRFAPADTGDADPSGAPKYRGRIYGGTDLEAPISSDWRDYLYFAFLHALRDVESDIRAWRRSPLRTLLEAAAAAVDETDLTQVREAMKNANSQMNELDVIKDLGTTIERRLLDMVGSNQAIETELAVAPDDPVRLIRNMRLFVDGPARRNLGSASLGTLNVLYLALLELGLDSRLLNADIVHVVMGIEEPEAHLHPHLQRLIFRRLLDSEEPAGTVIVSTQSPHIASVADPQSLVVLRNKQGKTVAAVAHNAGLSEAEWDDVGRYLDATRAELVFANKVLLVEGFAEQVLVPRLAAILGLDLDKHGITVCAISGTHFGTYAQFCNALDIPWAVITDGDPDDEGDLRGQKRSYALVQRLGLAGSPSDNGIFYGIRTFEYDLIEADTSNAPLCLAVLRELCAPPSRTVIDSWSGRNPGYDELMTMIGNAGGKGRYAQRLATQDVKPPEYVAEALTYLAGP